MSRNPNDYIFCRFQIHLSNITVFGGISKHLIIFVQFGIQKKEVFVLCYQLSICLFKLKLNAKNQDLAYTV